MRRIIQAVSIILTIGVLFVFFALGAVHSAQAQPIIIGCSHHAVLHQAVNCGAWRVTLNSASARSDGLYVSVTITNRTGTTQQLPLPSSIADSVIVPSPSIVRLLSFAPHQTRTLSPVVLALTPRLHRVTVYFNTKVNGQSAYIAWMLAV